MRNRWIICTALILSTLSIFILYLNNLDSPRTVHDIAQNKEIGIPFLSPDDFNPNVTIFDKDLFYVYTLTSLNREIFDIATGDFNNDNLIDIIFTGSYKNTKIFIIYNFDNFNFTYEEIFTCDNDIFGLIVDDFDNDDDLDIIFTSGENKLVNNTPFRINGTVNYLVNEGNMIFSNKIIVKRSTNIIQDSEGRTIPRITSADYDLDNDIDFIIGDKSGKIEIFWNDGNGNFYTGGIIYDFGSKSWGLESADLDNDGDIDLIVSSHKKEKLSEGHIFLKKNYYIESNNTICFHSDFGEIIANISFVPAVTSILSIDYDADLDNDILVGTSMLLYLLENDNGFFKPITLGYSPKNSTSEFETETLHLSGLCTIDINNDGRMDFLSGAGEGNIRLFINKN